MTRAIKTLVEETSFIDTHEHLIEEADRLAIAHPSLGCGDWSVLLSHYACSDLCASGLPANVSQRFFQESVPAQVKFEWIEHFWEHIRHTGYGQAVRASIKTLYDEDDLTRASVPRIAEKYADGLRPGFYDQILREHCRIENCHINTVQSAVFKESASPTLLRQDLDISYLCWPPTFFLIEQEFGFAPHDLAQWLTVIDSFFAQFAASAVAIKCKLAYLRRLDFDAPDPAGAELAFKALRSGEPLAPDQLKTLSDFLFHHCLDLARRYDLPIKLHTGIYYNNNAMPLHRVANNVPDLCAVFRDRPDNKFVLFHMSYPYQAEALAAAKHYTNVYVDMCWAWIIDPVSSVQFLKAFLTTAPSNKLFSFGGDFIPVELVVGHSAIARHGITRAFEGLISEGWIHAEEAPPLVERIMRGNAIQLYGA